MRNINVKLLNKYIDSLGTRGIEKLAIDSGLSVSLVEKLARGTVSNPTLSTICKICEATGLDFNQLFPLVGSKTEEAA